MVGVDIVNMMCIVICVYIDGDHIAFRKANTLDAEIETDTYALP